MRILAAAFFLLAATAPLFADDDKAHGTENVGVRVRAWFARMSGTVKARDPSFGSTRLDLRDDLGLGNQNLTPEVQVFGRIPYFGRLHGGWWRAEDSSDATLNRNVTFAGQTFPASTQVHSELRLDVFYLNYEIPIPTLRSATWSGWTSASPPERAASPATARSRGADSTARGAAPSVCRPWAPTLPGSSSPSFGRTSKCWAWTAQYGDSHAYYDEAYGEGVAKPLPRLFAGVGYKLAALNAARGGSHGFKVNVDVAGFHVTAGVRYERFASDSKRDLSFA